MNKPDSWQANSQEQSEYTQTEVEHTNKPVALPEAVVTLFTHLVPAQVEQFARSYHLWTIQQRLAQVQQEIASLQQQIADNASLTESVQPSPIALATLARLQASGVENLHLLDQMLDRGDTWLDHTAQLLERCEKLDLIRGDYTRWCENALEGAYDWLDSMNDEEASQDLQSSQAIQPVAQEGENNLVIVSTTEELLQKLMSDDDSIEEPLQSHQETTSPVLEHAEAAQGAMPSVVDDETASAPIQEQPTVEFPVAATQVSKRITQELPPLEEEAPISLEDMQTLPHATPEPKTISAEEQEPEQALEEIDTRPMTPQLSISTDQDDQLLIEAPEASTPSSSAQAIDEPEVTDLDEEDTIELVPRRKLQESTSPAATSAKSGAALATSAPREISQPVIESEQETIQAADQPPQPEETPGPEASPQKPQADEVHEGKEAQGDIEAPAPVAIEDEPTIPLRPRHRPNVDTEMQHNESAVSINNSKPEETMEATRISEEPGGQATQEHNTNSEKEKNLVPKKPQEEATGTSEKGLPVLVRKVLGQIWHT